MEILEEEDHARSQAISQLKGIVSLVKRLEHTSECTGDEDCELTDEEIYDGIGLYYESGKSKATDEEREEYHDEDRIQTTFSEDPLSVQVRSGWQSPGEELEAEDFEILLCTGGPAVRIVGELNRNQEPDRARIEYQDWGTPWIEYFGASSEERAAILTYAQQFFYQ